MGSIMCQKEVDKYWETLGFVKNNQNKEYNQILTLFGSHAICFICV